jgi:NADH-quinone oxidoreductase subunit F
MGTDFDFDLKLRLGAGAFVCGEETALIASIEGKRGEPKIRHLFQQPMAYIINQHL